VRAKDGATLKPKQNGGVACQPPGMFVATKRCRSVRRCPVVHPGNASALCLR